MVQKSISRDPALVELAMVWAHLPSGAAAIQGVVRHLDGGPTLGGSKVRDRPVGAGGIDVLFEGADPAPHQLGPDKSRWAQPDPTYAQIKAEARGWTLLTRADTIVIMISQGYQLRDSGQVGHVLHSDQADELVWHQRQGTGGRPSPFLCAAFAIRTIPDPLELT